MNCNKFTHKHRIQKEIEEFKNDPPIGCTGAPIDDYKIDKWNATIIGPSESPYSGGIFKLEITLHEKYPFIPPKIRFITPILHPNINSAGSICLDILTKNWSPALTVSKTLLSISSLLLEPNTDDPLDKSAATLYKNNREKFNKLARNHTLSHAF